MVLILPAGDDAPEQRHEADAATTEALARQASSSLESVDHLAAAAEAISDAPTHELAAEALQAVERLADHLVKLDHDREVKATVQHAAGVSPAGVCGVEGCREPAARFVGGADGHRLGVCARCAEELGAILP